MAQQPNVHRWVKLEGAAGTPAISGSDNLTVKVNFTKNTSLLQHRATIISGGDFDVQVDWDISPSANNGIGGWGVFLEARYIGDDDNRLRIYQSGANTTYIEQSYIDGSLTQTAVSNNAPSGAFRITRIGKTWQGYYKNLSLNWSQVGESNDIGRDAVEFRIYLQNWTVKPNITAYFDNFILNSGDYLCASSSSSSSSSISLSESSSSKSSSSSSLSSSSLSSSSSSSSNSISISSSSSSSSSSLSSSSSSSSLSSSSSSSSLSSSSSSKSSSSSSCSLKGEPITEWKGYKLEPDSTPTSASFSTEESKLVDKNRYIDFGTYWRDEYSYGIELGSQQALTKVKVYGNTNDSLIPSAWVPSAGTFEFYTSDNNSNWTLVKTVVNPTLHQYAEGQWGFHVSLATTGSIPVNQTCGVAVSGTWFKVRYDDIEHVATLTPGTSGIKIGEIELYGINSSSSSSSSSSESSSSSSESSSSSSGSSSSSSKSSSSKSSSSESSSSSTSSSSESASAAAGLDFTTFTEVDSNNLLSLTSTTATIGPDADALGEGYAYLDKGAGYFTGDFTLKFSFTISSVDGTLACVLAGVTTNIGGYNNYHGSGGFAGVEVSILSSNLNIRLNYPSSGGGVSTSYAYSVGTKYYVSLFFDHDGGSPAYGRLTGTVKTGSFEGVTVKDVDIKYAADMTATNQRYIQVWGLNNNSANNNLNATIEDFDVIE